MVPPGVHYYCVQVNDHPPTFDPFQPHVSTLSLIKLGLQGPLSDLLENANTINTSDSTVADLKPQPPPEKKPNNQSVKKGGTEDKEEGKNSLRPSSPARRPRGQTRDIQDVKSIIK